MLGSITAKYEN